MIIPTGGLIVRERLHADGRNILQHQNDVRACFDQNFLWSSNTAFIVIVWISTQKFPSQFTILETALITDTNSKLEFFSAHLGMSAASAFSQSKPWRPEGNLLRILATTAISNLAFFLEKKWVSQGGRSWQPFGERKNGHIIFVRRVFAIFATNSSFSCNIAILQIYSV